MHPAEITRTPDPIHLPPLKGLDLASRYFSARTGGDFFDAVVLGPHLVFLLTDIAGARLQAHTVAAAVQDTLRLRSPQLFGLPGINLTDAIATLAHELNQTILTALNRVCFSPTFLACFDTSLGLLAYLQAGGLPALFRDSHGTRTLGSLSVPLGLFSHFTYEPALHAFEPGDRLLLVTKGVTDSERTTLPFHRTTFSIDRVTSILQSTSNLSARELADTVIQQAHDFQKRPWYLPRNLPFTKARRTEDLTAVVLQRPL